MNDNNTEASTKELTTIIEKYVNHGKVSLSNEGKVILEELQDSLLELDNISKVRKEIRKVLESIKLPKITKEKFTRLTESYYICWQRS